MQVDHCVCPNCAALWHFEGSEDVGVTTHCDMCARNFRVGRWYGKFYPNLFGSLFRKPECPQCKSTNSARGRQVRWSFPDLYLRQCKDCCAVWVARK